MTTYAKREIVTTRVEYGVEAGGEVGDFHKVLAIAFSDYCERNGLDPDKSYTDNWARIVPRDEETVIVFRVEKEVKP